MRLSPRTFLDTGTQLVILTFYEFFSLLGSANCIPNPPDIPYYVLHNLHRIQSNVGDLKNVWLNLNTHRQILNNFLMCIKEFNIIELKICSRHRTQNTDRIMQEVSSARKETTYVKSESRAWRHRSWNMRAHDVDSDITMNSVVVLPPTFHLNHSNCCMKAACLRGEAFKPFVLIHRTRYVVLITLTTTRDVY